MLVGHGSAAHESPSASQQCRWRFERFEDAQRQCRQQGWCVGVTRDGGLRCHAPYYAEGRPHGVVVHKGFVPTLAPAPSCGPVAPSVLSMEAAAEFGVAGCQPTSGNSTAAVSAQEHDAMPRAASLQMSRQHVASRERWLAQQAARRNGL